MKTLDLSLSNQDGTWTKLRSLLDKEIHDFDKVKKALDFAIERHGEQRRISGEMYIVHPGWIAGIIAQLGIGTEAVIAALLHDVLEDTPTTLEEVSTEFGDEVALLVSGLTEVKTSVDKIILHSKSIDAFKNMLFSSVDDVRVLIIKIVDQVHNGLTINALSTERQLKYAGIVSRVYSPIAEYVGLHRFKQILDDIVFGILQPDKYVEIKNMIDLREKEEKIALAKIKYAISNMLKVNNVFNYELESRIKGLYSTYLKVKRSKGTYKFNDRVAVRVIVDNIANCYTILGLLHLKYRYMPEEFDDYISKPKQNGYRSLQTTLHWNDTTLVEVQIRTFEMHDFNEFGPASHIAYKMSGSKKAAMGLEWVRDLVAWEKNKDNALIQNYKIKVLQDFIYVFTPKGDVMQLSKGSTGLDFAFSIHRDIGCRAIGVLINKKMVKLGTELKTGDYVEVITGPKINVSQDWLEMTTNKHAREVLKKVLNGIKRNK